MLNLITWAMLSARPSGPVALTGTGAFWLMEDGSSKVLMEDGSSKVLMESA